MDPEDYELARIILFIVAVIVVICVVVGITLGEITKDSRAKDCPDQRSNIKCSWFKCNYFCYSIEGDKIVNISKIMEG
mgnify:CR=1 FL=1